MARSLAGTYPVGRSTLELIPDPQRDGGYTLTLDHIPSSYLVVGAPRVLGFDYMVTMAEIIRGHVSSSQPHLVHLGGAGMSLPRWAADVWPQSHNTVAEINRDLAQLVPKLFHIPSNVVTRVVDARTLVHALGPASADVIIRDVFAGPTTPRALTTVEFFRAASRALKEDGLYLANCGDTLGGTTVKEEYAGLKQVFSYVVAIGDSNVLAGREHGNAVLMAAKTPPLRVVVPDGVVVKQLVGTTARVDESSARYR